MGWFGKSGDHPRDFSSQSPPWDTQRTSIYNHINKHLAAGTLGSSEGRTLPDEERLTGQLKFVAGGLDGAFGHHGQTGQEKNLARKLVRALTALLKAGNEKAVREFYDLVVSTHTIDFIDPLVEEFLQRHDVQDTSLYAFAKWLVKGTPDREPLKVGIALLGLCATAEDEHLFLEIGAHEEFTLYCAVALCHSAADPEIALWNLAKVVHGWGRIQLVERLAETENAEIKEWLVRDGYNNSVMHEYTALICATAGDLLRALSVEHPDAELLMGATDIIAALIAGGPAPGIEEYDEAAPAVHRLVFLLETRDVSLKQFVALAKIRDYLAALDPLQGGWSAVLPQASEMCTAILERPDWESKVRSALERQNEPEFWYATEAASILNLDIWEIMFQRVQDGNPDWYHVMKTKDEERLRRAVAFAERTLPLEKIACGVADEMGMGPEYKDHQALDWILQELRNWPGHGLTLVRTGLRSPVIRNRNMALVALQTWGRDHWGPDIEDELRSLQREEPNQTTRELIAEILSKE